MEPAAARAKAEADLAEQLPPDGAARHPHVHRGGGARSPGRDRAGSGPSRDPGSGPWIYDIAVDAQHRGRGFGRALMLEAERRAREAGETNLGLNVFGGNTVGHRALREPGLPGRCPADEQAAPGRLTGSCGRADQPARSRSRVVVEVEVSGLGAARHQLEGRGEEGLDVGARRLEERLARTGSTTPCRPRPHLVTSTATPRRHPHHWAPRDPPRGARGRRSR